MNEKWIRERKICEHQKIYDKKIQFMCKFRKKKKNLAKKCFMVF